MVNGLILRIFALALVSGYLGYNLHGIIYQAELSKAIKEERLKLLKSDRLNRELLKKLDIAKAENRTIYKTVTEKIYVPKEHKEDSICNIDSNTKLLLNNFIKGVPTTADRTTNTTTEPSDIRTKDLILSYMEHITLYKDAQAQCNTLIESIKRNR